MEAAKMMTMMKSYDTAAPGFKISSTEQCCSLTNYSQHKNELRAFAFAKRPARDISFGQHYE
jgi:hypothetical protein